MLADAGVCFEELDRCSPLDDGCEELTTNPLQGFEVELDARLKAPAWPRPSDVTGRSATRANLQVETYSWGHH